MPYAAYGIGPENKDPRRTLRRWKKILRNRLWPENIDRYSCGDVLKMVRGMEWIELKLKENKSPWNDYSIIVALQVQPAKRAIKPHEAVKEIDALKRKNAQLQKKIDRLLKKKK